MIGCRSHIQQLAATNLYSKRYSHPLYFAAIRLYAASGLEFRRLLLFSHLGAYFGKGTYWQCLRKFDCRETTLSNTANHLKIFLIAFELCLYKHLYFLYIRNPLFPIVVFISMLWQLKVNMFYQKNSFPIVKKHQKVR